MALGRSAVLGLLFAFASCETAGVALEIGVRGSGETSPAAGVTRWAPGTQVVVRASPGAGAEFLGWSGAATGSKNPITLTMDTSKVLVAEFSQGTASNTEHWLVIEVNGNGTTDPSPERHLYPHGEQIEVLAIPAAGATFTGWNGAAMGTDYLATLILDEDKTLTANFSGGGGDAGAIGEDRSLEIRVNGDGTTTPAEGTHSYPEGSEVKVTAKPANGTTFAGWSGAATGTANPAIVKMNGDKTLTATFSSSSVNYTLAIGVNGSGTTSPAAGNRVYAAGTEVKVTATPSSGASFTGWSGAATGTANPTTVKMDANKTLTANFSSSSVSYTLAINVNGNGTTNPAAGSRSYTSGTEVTVNATPSSGATFTGWSGAATGATNPTTVKMDANKTLTATFSGGGGSGTCTGPAPGSKGTNPLFSDVFTADPAPLVDNCTFYIACGHDQAASGQNGFVMREWYLLSSTDMVNWTKKVAMSLSTFRWANANAWAGQIVRGKNGRFFWYVPIQESSTGAMAIGVAVADSPGGPWTDAINKPLVNDAFEMSNMGYRTPSDTAFTIDPTVFVDDDGQAYLHYGGFGRLVEARLNSDMVSINGKMQESTPSGFFEAPFLMKRNNTYYEIYAAGSNPATIDYATSNSPLGPWKRGGRVLDTFPKSQNDSDWPTNHAGVAKLGDQWYVVYHVSDGPNGGGTYRREVAIDKLNFNSDGSIQKVTPSKGLSF